MVNYSLCELSLHILSVSFLLFKQAFIGKKKFIVALILNSKNFTLSRIRSFAGNLYILNVKKDTPPQKWMVSILILQEIKRKKMIFSNFTISPVAIVMHSTQLIPN